MSKMPVVFIGHGSPMNAIEENSITKQWKEIAASIAKPKAIVMISAHWYIKGTKIQSNQQPQTIYDMYGFPKELYDIVYSAKGDPQLAQRVSKHISRIHHLDETWGYDHGTWSVLVHMYPDADIPVFQISIDAYASAEEHYQIGKELSFLRDEGVLIMGSGNVVHNLRLLDWEKPKYGFGWAIDFDDFVKNALRKKDDEAILAYKQHKGAYAAVPSNDHFNPLLYCLGASDEKDRLEVYCEEFHMGSLSMSSYVWRP